MHKKYKIILFIIISIVFFSLVIFFSCNGIEYYREVKAEKVLTEYLKTQNQKKYDNYMMASVKEDRFIGSLRLNQTMWVIFDDEPNYIYQYLYNLENELYIYSIKDMSKNKYVTKGKHGVSINDRNYDEKPLIKK